MCENQWLLAVFYFCLVLIISAKMYVSDPLQQKKIWKTIENFSFGRFHDMMGHLESPIAVSEELAYPRPQCNTVFSI